MAGVSSADADEAWLVIGEEEKDNPYDWRKKGKK